MLLDRSISVENKKSKNKSSAYAIFFILIMSVFLLAFVIGANTISASPSYTPAAPVGETSGGLDTDYEYKIYTIDTGSSWMFDWGDGTYSDWITVDGSNTFISQQHSWSNEGVYEVRVKYRSIYLDESPWSPSLTVNIGLSAGSGADSDTTIDDSDDETLDSDSESSSPVNDIFEIPWLYIIIGIIIIAIVTIFILIKTGVIYLYEEEYTVEE